MRRKRLSFGIGILASVLCLSIMTTDVIELSYPSYFPAPHYNFENNVLTKSKIKLGRALFYDPLLSKDLTISCASCHSPYNAFAHTDHDLSHGIDDQIGTRNAPALFNLAWQSTFMWDGAIRNLDMQALAPLEHKGEMGEKLSNVISKLNASAIYKPLFLDAFGDTLATGEHMLKALSQFQLTLISANAKYDKVKKGEAIFTDQEIKGYQLFKNNCGSCHKEPLFTNSEFKRNGLVVDTILNDYGRMIVTGEAKDSLLFKVPTLRNIEYTYPYMHDGRLENLSSVMKHYGGIDSLSVVSKELAGISLSSHDRVDLLSFLLTLSDPQFVFIKTHHYPRDILYKN